MPYLPPPPTEKARALPLVAGDAWNPVDLTSPEGERRSDCVAGFQYKRWRQVTHALALFAYVPFFPLWPFVIAKESKDWSIATKDYFKTLRYCLKAAYDHIAYGSIWRLFKYNILHGPEYVKKRIEMRRGACTRCAKCCRAFNCIFLGQDETSGDFYCKVFGTSYWYYGTCGRYPIDQQDIDDHGCPGFSFPKTEEEWAEAKKKLPPRKLPVVETPALVA
jgi:hypothetical protein